MGCQYKWQHTTYHWPLIQSGTTHCAWHGSTAENDTPPCATEGNVPHNGKGHLPHAITWSPCDIPHLCHSLARMGKSQAKGVLQNMAEKTSLTLGCQFEWQLCVKCHG